MSKNFDPTFIIYQIICIQCFFYLAMGTFWGICHVIFESPVSLEHFFTPKYIRFATFEGWISITCTFLSGIVGAYLLLAIVERSKKCLDFTFTLYFIHIILCTIYNQFPLDWQWWIVQVVSSVTMATLGEYWCSRNELEDIPLYTPE